MRLAQFVGVGQGSHQTHGPSQVSVSGSHPVPTKVAELGQMVANLSRIRGQDSLSNSHFIKIVGWLRTRDNERGFFHFQEPPRGTIEENGLTNLELRRRVHKGFKLLSLLMSEPAREGNTNCSLLNFFLNRL